MHSFHQSRGRIFFEVLCALAVSVSCVGTWMQTGASAMLPAAAATLLYALVHSFDMAGRKSAAAATGQRRGAPTADVESAAPAEQPMTEVPFQKSRSLAVQAAPPARKVRQPKAPRKKSKAAEVAPAEEAKVVEFVPDEDPQFVVHDEDPEVVVHDEDPEAVLPMPFDEEHHASVTPLFEPVPFVRQQRTGFGRKSG